MLATLSRLLTPPELAAPRDRRAAAIVHAAALIGTFTTLPAAVLAIGDDTSGLRPVLLAIVGVACLVAIVLVRRGSVRPAAWIAATVTFVVVAAAVFRLGGVRSIPFLGLVLVIVFASFTMGRAAALTFGGGSVVVLTAAYVLERTDAIDYADDVNTSTQAFVARLIGTGLFVAILVVRNRQSERAFADLEARERDLETALAGRGELERFNQRVLDLSLSVIYIGDARTGAPVYVNREFTAQTGYTVEMLRAMSIAELRSLIHDDDRAAIDVARERVRNRPDDQAESTEFRYRAADGTWRTWIARDAPFLRDASGDVIQNIITGVDVTDLRRAEAQNRELQQFNQRILDVDMAGVYLTAPDVGSPIFVNPQYTAMTGYSLEELQAMSSDELRGLVDPDDRAALDLARQSVQEASEDTPVAAQFRFRRKDGSVLHALAQLAPFSRQPDGRVSQTILTAVDIGAQKAAETAALENADALADALRDVQRRRRALERTNRDLERANAELEQFVYIASHDLQEPVRTVGNFAGLLEQRYADAFDERGQRALEFIGEATDRMSALIRSLLDYSRLGQHALATHVDLGGLVGSVQDDLAAVIDETGAEVTVGELPEVLGFEPELQSLVQNLISNAIKFAKPDEPPRVRITADRLEDAWQISVADDGIGIDPRYHDRVFQIFQQLDTGRRSEGTGIGLAHCKKIVELHGGSIWFASEPGIGTTFYFTLPDRPEDHHETSAAPHSPDR